MTNLNSASIEEIVAIGVTPNAAHAMAFWGPFRCWEDLLWVSEVDDAALDRLKPAGFEINPPNFAAWAAPKPFRLSASTSF